MSRLLREASLSQRTANLEDQHRRVESQVVELLTHVFWLTVELAGGCLDAAEDVDAHLHGVLAAQLLVVLRVLLVVALSISKGFLKS